MKHVGVCGLLVLVSGPQCCLHWATASQSLVANFPGETNGEVQTNNWGVGLDSPVEADSIQQRTLNASLDAAGDTEENGDAQTEEDADSAQEHADIKNNDAFKTPARNMAIGVSLLLFLCMGLLAITGRKQAAGPPLFIEEDPTGPELTPEEQRELQLERMQAISDAAGRIANAVGGPEAVVLLAELQQSVQKAREASDIQGLQKHWSSVNQRVGELDELAKEYISSLMERHSTMPAFPEVVLKEKDKEVPFLELVDRLAGCLWVRCAAKAMISLQEKTKTNSEIVEKLGDHLAGLPTYENEKDKGRLEQRANGIEYLKAMVASKSLDLSIGSRLKDAAVEGYLALLCRDHKDWVLAFDGDLDLLKVSLAAIQKRQLHPEVDRMEYKAACAVVEKHVTELEGAVAEMRVLQEELQRSQTLQAAHRTSDEFTKIMEQTKTKLKNMFIAADELDIGIDVGSQSKDSVPQKVIRAYDTISPEAHAVQDLLRTLKKRVNQFEKESTSVSGEQSLQLSSSILSDMLSSVEGVEVMTDGILRKAREGGQLSSYMAEPQDIALLLEEYKSQMATMTRARSGAQTVSLEVTLFSILQEELKRQVNDAEVAAAFKFPEGSPFERKMLRLKMRFDDAAEHITRVKTLTNVEESLAASRGIVKSMQQLIRESLMRDIH